MTWLQWVMVKIVMLAVAVGLLFWAVNADKTAESESPVTAQFPTTEAETTAEAEAEQGDEPVFRPDVDVKVPGASAAPLTRERAATVPSSARPAPSPRRAAPFPLDINRVGVEDLAALPGLGDILAQRVVEYRKRHGGFRSVDELQKVRGIGKKRMEQLRPLVITAESK